MITDKPIEPTATEAAVYVAHEVTSTGRLVTVTTVHAPGLKPDTRRDWHTPEYSLAIAREIVIRQERTAALATVAESSTPKCDAALADASRKVGAR